MVAYEATKKGWWSSNLPSGFVSGHPFFGDLWNKGVEFYDVEKKARKSVKLPFLTKSFAAGIGLSFYE